MNEDQNAQFDSPVDAVVNAMVKGGANDQDKPRPKPAAQEIEEDEDKPASSKPDNDGADGADASGADLPNAGNASDDMAAADDNADSDDDADADNSEVDKSISLQDIADQLEVDAAELYEIEINLGAEEGAISLGELKDEYQMLLPLKERLLNVDEQEIQSRNDRMQQHRDLEAIVSLLPDQAITPQFIEAARSQLQRSAQVETQKLLTAQPEWAHAAVYQAARQDMTGQLQEYGLSETDLDGIQDHRFILMLNDFAALKKKYSEASRVAKKVPKKPSKAGNSSAARQGAKAQKKKLAASLRNRAKSGDKQAQQEIVGGLFSQ